MVDGDDVASDVAFPESEPSGIFLLGLFNSSSVIPSSLVIPTTGGSPFFTNSYNPVTRLITYG